MINAEMKMADVIHMNHQLLKIINRFGIQLGFGDKNIDSICKEYGVNTEFFLEIINAYHDKNYFPKQHLLSFPLSLIIQYLSNTHVFYLQNKIPEIERLIAEMVSSDKSDKQNLLLLKNFFKEYKNELTAHIDREEATVYPFVLKICNAFEQNLPKTEVAAIFEDYSIDIFKDEHDNIDEKLYDLKNIIIKYLPPHKNNELSLRILSELFELEQDVNDHSRIEDTVLIPKVQMMEIALRKQIEG